MKKRKHKIKYSKINDNNSKSNTNNGSEKNDLRLDFLKNKINEQEFDSIKDNEVKTEKIIDFTNLIGNNKKLEFTMLEELEKQQEPLAFVAVAPANDPQKGSVVRNARPVHSGVGQLF